MSFLTDVQNAIVERWLGYDSLTDVLGGPHIFSRQVPPDFVFPEERRKYIILGEKTDVPVAVMANGSSTTLMVHPRTHGYYDDAPVEELAYLMDEAIEEQPFVLEGYGGIVIRREFRAVMGDPDNEAIRHAPTRYRISTLKV